MTTPTLPIYQILPGGIPQSVHLPDATSLDVITRQLPDGLYTTFRTFGGRTRVIGLRAHLARLYDPLPALQVTPHVAVDVLRRALAALLADFSADEARVRLVLTLQRDPGAVYAAFEPLRPLARSVYEHGVRVVTITDLGRETPTLKSSAFISKSQQERAHLAQAQAFEGLLVKNGRILEGMTSNFFYVRDGVLGTARRGVLLGVTRSMVIAAARAAGISVVYRALPVAQVSGIHEAFITSSSRGVVPVVAVDDISIGAGHPGPVTQRLMDGYHALALRRAEKI
ncbi:MAG: aminotransferase class IV [Anaerolineales bacterium]